MPAYLQAAVKNKDSFLLLRLPLGVRGALQEYISFPICFFRFVTFGAGCEASSLQTRMSVGRNTIRVSLCCSSNFIFIPNDVKTLLVKKRAANFSSSFILVANLDTSVNCLGYANGRLCEKGGGNFTTSCTS